MLLFLGLLLLDQIGQNCLTQLFLVAKKSQDNKYLSFLAFIVDMKWRRGSEKALREPAIVSDMLEEKL